jgi:FkbM family methyltransferase
MNAFIRNFLENTTHRLVFRRHLPSPFGDIRLYVTTDGGLRYLKPSLRNVDPTLLKLVKHYVTTGDTVWDIGANLGLFTFPAARIVGPSGKVISIEPDAWLATLLRRSVQLNNVVAQVEVICTACANSFGVGVFDIAKRSRSTNHLEGFGSTQTGGIRERQLVPVLPIDALLANHQPPDIIKIDVEGAEILVLQGATDVLKNRPILIIEIASENSEIVKSILEPLEYIFFDGENLDAGPLPNQLTYTTVAVPMK